MLGCAPSVDLRHGNGTCDYACSGAAGTTCGGYDAFDLFELEEVGPASPPTEDYYVGCFADDGNDHVLEDMMSSGGMPLQVSAPPPGACLHGNRKTGLGPAALPPSPPESSVHSAKARAL